MSQSLVGIVGLGRLGMKYAQILSEEISNVRLVAVCSLSQEELNEARERFDQVTPYNNYNAFLNHPSLDIVFVLSSTNLHAQHMIAALNANKHVFSEKPLSLEANECLKVIQKARQKQHLFAMVGFVRRFDQSYRYAKEKVENGAIGQPFMVKSQTVDKDTIASFQLEYVRGSGGIFHDFNVHDIDLARWFLGGDIVKVYSVGGSYKHEGFADAGDADNVITTCTFDHGGIAILGASRTAMHGHDTYTEIVGTQGTLRIGRPPALNRVEIYDQHGVRQECVETFWDRFESAFILMIKQTIEDIQQGNPPQITLSDAYRTTEVAEASTASFRSGNVISFEPKVI